MPIRSLKPLSLFFLIIMSFNCSSNPGEQPPPPYQYAVPVQTGDGWETGALSTVGLSESPIVRLVRDIDADVFTEIHSVVIVKDHTLVFERYWPGHDFGLSSPDYLGRHVDFDLNTRHNTHSAAKSFASALVGLAIDAGFIPTEDEVIFNYLGAAYQAWRNEGRENITIKHCLMMASGLQWSEWGVPASSDENDMMGFNQDPDPVRYLLMKPVVAAPGSLFHYNGGTVDLLGVIVANATGQSISVFSAERLFGPLGISNYRWQTLYPSGLTCCHGDIYLTPRDMAKFGQLYLNNGEWNSERVVSSEWIERSTQNYMDPGVTWADGYGYLWWRRVLQANGNTYESFKAIGWGGQEIFVFRSLNMVVVLTGANYVSSSPCDAIVENYVLPALR